MSGSAARRCLCIVLGVIVLLRCIAEYRSTLAAHRHIRALPYESYFRPGVVPCVDWVKAQGTVHAVYGLDHAQDRYLNQRLSEMLYPIPFRPFTTELLKSGDIVILPADRTLSKPAEPVFRNGQLQILRVKP